MTLGTGPLVLCAKVVLDNEDKPPGEWEQGLSENGGSFWTIIGIPDN